MKPEISIIVPVYKVEKTLRQCLDSILRQTFKNWELIAINDCSPDGSAKILAEYEKKDGRIKVVDHSENRGVSQARFTGLARASGKYIVFADSDDWMPRRALEKMHGAIETMDADMVTGGMVKVVGRLGIVRTAPRNTSGPENMTGTIEMPELLNRYFISWLGGNMFIPCMAGKIYRRAVIEKAGLEPVPFRYGEDLIFQMMLHPHLTRIGFIADPVYFYRTGGSTSTSVPYMLDDVKKQYPLKLRCIEKYNYQKALPRLKADLMENFFYHFRNQVMLDGVGYERVAELIAEELRDDFYDDEIMQGAEPTPVAAAVASRDPRTIVRMIEENVKRTAPRHKLVKAISKII